MGFGAVHRFLGHALYALHDYRQAALSYERARAQGFFEAAEGAYRIAACYALAGDADLAFHWLELALRSRLKDRSRIGEDPRFQRLHGDRRFADCIGALPKDTSGREAGWRYDLTFLASEIKRLHPSYAGGLPRAFEERLHSLEQRVDTLTDRHIAVEVMALIATLGDAHSVMMPFGMKKGVLGRLPIQLYTFSDGTFVINAPDSQRELVGSEVVEIGGRGIGQLSSAMRPYLSRDNDQFLCFAVPFGLTMPDLLAVIGADVQGGKVSLKVRRNGRMTTVAIDALEGPLDPEKLPLKLIPAQNGKPPPDYLAHLREHVWLKLIGSNMLYVQINQCHDSPGKSAVIATRQTTIIRASITAYSTAVGPSSRFRNSRTCVV